MPKLFFYIYYFSRQQIPADTFECVCMCVYICDARAFVFCVLRGVQRGVCRLALHATNPLQT